MALIGSGIGAGPRRERRRSDLLLGWRSIDLSLDCYTGQTADWRQTDNGTDVLGTVTGINGAAVSAMTGIPRFEQANPDGKVRLAMISNDATKIEEYLRWAFAFTIFPLSVLVKVFPLSSPGANISPAQYLCYIGNGTTNGGYLSLSHEATAWCARRAKGGTSLLSQVTEPGSATYPIEVMATFSSGGSLIVSTRDAAGVIATGNTVTNSALAVTTDQWDDGLFHFGSPGDDNSGNGNWRLESCKIARGVQTFAQFDLLR